MKFLQTFILLSCFLTIINGETTVRSTILPTRAPHRNVNITDHSKIITIYEVTTVGIIALPTIRRPQITKSTTENPITIPTKRTWSSPFTSTTKNVGEKRVWFLEYYRNLPYDKKQVQCGANLGDDHPWLVMIEHSDPTHFNKRKTLSKGFLIDAQHVMTTVSSLHNSYPFWVVSGVRLGDYITWGTTGLSRNRSAVVTVGIDKVFMHKTKDVAIIRLSEPINITNSIQPICLPSTTGYNFHQMYLHMCKKVYRKNGPPRAEITMESVSPLSPQDCTTMFHRQNANITSTEFCAWDVRGDTCTGDLGGPLIVKHGGLYYVIGLTSYIHSQKIISSDKFPGVYTHVGSHLNWIKKILNE